MWPVHMKNKTVDWSGETLFFLFSWNFRIELIIELFWFLPITAVRLLTILFFQNGRWKQEQQCKDKQTDKNNKLTPKAPEGGSQLQTTGLEVQEVTVSQKLDILLVSGVKDRGTHLEDHGECLCKQEEIVSIHNISALPSAHSSPKALATSVAEPPQCKPDKIVTIF